MTRPSAPGARPLDFPSMIAARSRLLPVLLAVLAGPLSAQGSPNVPLDDPRLPLVEFLIIRGSIQDPSPMHRPFRRADLVASLERADSTPGSDSTLVRTLLAQYKELDAPQPLRRGRARRLPGHDHRSLSRPDASRRQRRHLSVRRRPARGRVRSGRGGQPPRHRTARHRRPRLAGPEGPHGRGPHGRGLSRLPVQDLGTILVRPVRPELGAGQLLRSTAQQLRLSAQLLRARCGLAERAADRPGRRSCATRPIRWAR